MCPDPKLISIYIDGELPSPWKEKMTSHLAECPICREKLESFKSVQVLFAKNTHQERTFVERSSKEHSSEYVHTEQEFMEAAKEKVWKKLQLTKRPVQRLRNYNVWQRKVSIPWPMAAAAAILLIFGTALWIGRGSSNNNSGYANLPVLPERSGFAINVEESIPNVITASDLNSVIQSLGGDRTEIIILQLPESSNFFSSGEPAMIRAADFVRR
jgi:anti-sigma factor RsiW